MKEKVHPLYWYGIAATVVVVIFVLLVTIYPPSIKWISQECVFLSITGRYCPGCGGTRSVLYLIKGDIVKSFIYHPVVLYVGVVYGYYLCRQTIGLLQKEKKIIKVHNLAIWMMIALIFLNWIIKNGLDMLKIFSI